MSRWSAPRGRVRDSVFGEQSFGGVKDRKRAVDAAVAGAMLDRLCTDPS